MANVINRRMPSGVPGDVSRKQDSVIEPAVLNPTLPFPGYGLPGKVASGKFVPIASGDAAAAVAGFFVRPFPAQDSTIDGTGIAYGLVGDRLRSGYMTVKNNAGVPAENGQVYVRVAAAAAGKPIGGIEAAADSTNTIAVDRCVFMSAADADGNVEIRFNL